eukprot:8727554-Pyramimonas_sp.AAC.1
MQPASASTRRCGRRGAKPDSDDASALGAQHRTPPCVAKSFATMSRSASAPARNRPRPFSRKQALGRLRQGPLRR